MTTRRTSRLYLTISQVFMSLCIGLTPALIVTEPAAAQELTLSPSPCPSPCPNLRARTDPWAQLTPEEKAEISMRMADANSMPPGQIQDMDRMATVMRTV